MSGGYCHNPPPTPTVVTPTNALSNTYVAEPTVSSNTYLAPPISHKAAALPNSCSAAPPWTTPQISNSQASPCVYVSQARRDSQSYPLCMGVSYPLVWAPTLVSGRACARAGVMGVKKSSQPPLKARVSSLSIMELSQIWFHPPKLLALHIWANPLAVISQHKHHHHHHPSYQSLMFLGNQQPVICIPAVFPSSCVTCFSSTKNTHFPLETNLYICWLWLSFCCFYSLYCPSYFL